jgi:adenosine deaminase
VLATINSDDPAVQGVDIRHEYEHAAPAAGLSPAQIRKAQENGLEIAFLSQAEKQALCLKASAR